jgi:phage baseplate assembly protein W
LLGWGIAAPLIAPGADLERDIILKSDPTDADTVSGFANLAQVLEIALTTALGGDVFNVGFGFDGANAMVEATDTVLARERVRIAIIQVLTRDPRVRRIIDLKVLDRRLDPDGWASGISDPVDRWRTLTVNVAFEAVSGEQLTVNLGGVIPNG